MNSISNNWKLFFLITLCIAIFPVLTYWWKFGTGNLSTNFKDWVDFSTYWSPLLVVALTLVLAHISWQSLEIMKAKEKPFIVIEKRALKGKEELLSIRNIGSGPALDVKLFIKVINNEKIYQNKFLKRHDITSFLDFIEKHCDYHYMVSAFSLS